jgi:shikimate kinase
MATTRSEKRPRPGTPALEKSIVLVGLMGAGKSSIGRLLARRLGLEFVDADTEIEAAAGASIEEIFKERGEAAFRSGERRVIARLLAGSACIIATGGGAFMNADTRSAIKKSAISVWLKADVETLLKRVSRRGGRPLLKNKDPRSVLNTLVAERDPIYARADVTVVTSDHPPTAITDRVISALEKHLGIAGLAPAPPRKGGKSQGSAKPLARNTKTGAPKAKQSTGHGAGNRRRRSRPRRST